METAERSELDATIKLMRGELKQARLYLAHFRTARGLREALNRRSRVPEVAGFDQFR